jgi:hypothetical protein
MDPVLWSNCPEWFPLKQCASAIAVGGWNGLRDIQSLVSLRSRLCSV